MYPILFRIGDFTVTSYGVMLVLAFVGAGLVVAAEWRRRGWEPGAAQDIVLAAMVGGVVGSKLYWALAHWSDLAADPVGTLFSRGGFTYYGGLIGGIVTVVAWLAWRKYPLARAVDSCALAVPVGYMLGRIGCLLVGDDYGYPTDVPWAMAFPEGSPPTIDPVHPTQIYEILLTLPIFLVMWSQRKRPLPDGFLFFELLLLAGLERFVVEFYRVNVEVALGLTAAQWISLALAATGLAGIAWVYRRPSVRSPQSVTERA
ncbi:MAG TPA: prolipoprotein diacylglyceryl transferase [Gemmatimonadota bacterium]|nr:prolipoprotein diacylglyceryl transferase [Gemmatimonadota bacterium]